MGTATFLNSTIKNKKNKSQNFCASKHSLLAALLDVSLLPKNQLLQCNIEKEWKYSHSHIATTIKYSHCIAFHSS